MVYTCPLEYFEEIHVVSAWKVGDSGCFESSRTLKKDTTWSQSANILISSFYAIIWPMIILSLDILTTHLSSGLLYHQVITDHWFCKTIK